MTTARWAKGQSGNSRGRPPGTGKVAELREAIAKDVPAIVKTLTDAAKAGDVAAARLLLDRVLPALKPVEETVFLSLDGDTLTDKGRATLEAIGGGHLAPGQGASLLAAIGAMAKLVETDELTRRIEALEGKNAST